MPRPFPIHWRLLPAAALCVAGAGFSPAEAQEVPWLAHAEPMGAKASQLIDKMLKANPSPETAAQLVREAMQLPPGQSVAVLEDIMSRDAMKRTPMSNTVKDAVLQLLATDPACPLSRQLANWVLMAPSGRTDLWRRALRRLNTPEVVKTLAAWSRDQTQTPEFRVAALRALGGLSSLDSLEVLLDTTANDWSLRDEAGKALSEMFYLSAPPTLAQLAEWRGMQKRRDVVAFRLYLKDRLEEALRVSRADNGQLVARLVRQEETLFDNERSEDRQAHLVRMLGDKDLPDVRLKALELVDKQLQFNQPIEAVVRDAMRAAITDPVPQVRANSIALLSNLRDEPSAQVVAKRLAAGVEDNMAVVGAMVGLMKRDPQPEALPAVVRLLEAPLMRAAAADALAAYEDKKMLDAAACRAISGSLKTSLAKEADPGVPMVLLLGSTLGADDKVGWDMQRAWLSNSRGTPALRQAAALALAKSTQPLAPLLACVNDADGRLAETALRAVGERGGGRADVVPLLAHPPEAGAKRDAWGDALLGWTGRASPADIDAVARQVADSGAGPNEAYKSKLAVRMLGKALARKKLSNENRALLLLCRGQVAEGAGDLAAAQDDFDAAYAWLPVSERAATLGRRVRLRLTQSKLADAAQVWAKAAADNAAPDMLKESLAQVMEKVRELGEPEDKANIGNRAQAVEVLKVLAAGMKDKPAAALAGEVEPWLAQWAPPPPPPPPPPETKPGEAKQGEAKSNEVKPKEAKPDEAKPGEVKPGEAKPAPAAKPDAAKVP